MKKYLIKENNRIKAYFEYQTTKVKLSKTIH